MNAAKKSKLKPRAEAETLCARIVSAPRVRRASVAAAKVKELTARAGRTSPLLAKPAPPLRALLGAIGDHAPYIWGLAVADPERLSGLLACAPEMRFDACLELMWRACEAAADDEAILRALRLGKQEGHLLIALCDLGGVWNVDQVMMAVTRLADHATRCATRYALRQAHRQNRLRLPDLSDPERASGLVLLALGKHGAMELNYSSDIDLVAFFDPLTPALVDPFNATTIYVRVTQMIARLLQEHTGDGYAFRVDLRLRPDPSSTAIAVPLPQAFSYYENLGQNWERAAFIKARPVAGEVALGENFLKDLTPFLWRRYFDYAAIADIHAMKRQIHAVRGYGEIGVAGHDIKLGRGGIREVEFFVQTQQLIFGGRRPDLRGARTLDMLRELAADGWITPEATADLSTAYRFLREIEHRLQMIADQQTQKLPLDADALESYAMFCGYAGTDAFGVALTRQLECVERHYARLFETEPGLASTSGSLVFTGVSDDAETLQTLSKLGFTDPARAAETVRGWHFGRRPAMQSARAREVMTGLVPALLEAFGGSGDPDAALSAFDNAMARMPAAVELFSILKSNDKVRELFADLLGGAPRLAQIVSLRPHVLDAAIDPSHMDVSSSAQRFAERANRILTNALDHEQFLDDCRDIAEEEKFLIGIRFLAGVMSAEETGRAYTAFAETMVSIALSHVSQLLAAEHGVVAGGRCAVVGMGKLGSREMTSASDLDLILMYDYAEITPESDGARPLHATQYYARLTKRLVAVMTASTRRGKLYDVDLRLRPSGGQGPVATRLSSFIDYQSNDAETWEHMALTRARVIAGDPTLGRDIEAARQAVLRAPPDLSRLRADVLAMRRLIAEEKGEDDPWDLKLAAGGIVDIEFIAQYLVLANAHDMPGILDTSTTGVIARAARAGSLPRATAAVLADAARLYDAVTQMMRLAIGGPFDPAHVASSVLKRIANSVNLPDFARVELDLREKRAAVREAFLRLMQSET